MELFKKIAPEAPRYAKTASSILLSDDPSAWDEELRAGLYSQHPWLGKYNVDLRVKSQDESIGTMYGFFVVAPRSSAPVTAAERGMTNMTPQDMPTESEAGDTNMVRIPVIVDGKKVKPLDVFIGPDDTWDFLSQSNVSTVLFNASGFGTANPQAMGGTSQSDFRPDLPDSGYGNHRMMNSNYAGAKLASVRIGADVMADFMAHVQSLEGIIPLIKESATARGSLRKVASQVRGAAPDFYPMMAGGDPALLSYGSDGFSLRYSEIMNEEPRVVKIALSNVEAAKFPVNLREQAMRDGHAAFNESDAGVHAIVRASTIKQAGAGMNYLVSGNEGEDGTNLTTATVITNVMGLNGLPSDTYAVIGERGVSQQEKVASLGLAPDVEMNLSAIKASPLRGDGFFVLPSSNAATEVIKVASVTESGTGVRVLADHPLHGRVHIEFGETKAPIMSKQANAALCLLPRDAIFVSCGDAPAYARTGSEVSALLYQKTKQASVVATEHGYMFRGDVAHSGEHGLDDSLAILMGQGASLAQAKEKLAAAESGLDTAYWMGSGPARRGHAAFKDSGPSELCVNFTKEAMDVARAIDMPHFATRMRLAFEAAFPGESFCKEAAKIGSETVDSALSLNFVTPENIQLYLDSMPDLKVASGALAKILIGVRLGVPDVNEQSASSALRGMNKVLDGLKRLQIRADYDRNRADQG
jgi:hypothetical protein